MGSYEPQWTISNHPARLWTPMDDDRVVCHLSPRNCTLREGQYGFCGVRRNIGGKLVTLNYGCATQMTLESIETEAVFHFAPGAEILSLGNLGCMMNCDYCHNWQTSQAKFVSRGDVHYYTPEQVVDYAAEQGVSILSWTYNDPVVWHEFVLDAGRLARERGMTNLYKSAFFISLEGARELCEVVDIFSVSLKTMNEALYRKISKGWLPPVLDATRLVYEEGKHVEISNLMVTDSNDSVDEAKALAEWVLENLSDRVPLHFVRFHPDYKYTHVGRTPIDRLYAAREAALEMGIKYCYLGNVYDDQAGTTLCSECGVTLVKRYGLNTEVVGLDSNGNCQACGASADMRGPIVPRLADKLVTTALDTADAQQEINVVWEDDVNACHVEVVNGLSAHDNDGVTVLYSRLAPDGTSRGPFAKQFVGRHHRFILSKAADDEIGICLELDERHGVQVFRVFDRAHYPTQSGMTDLPVLENRC